MLLSSASHVYLVYQRQVSRKSEIKPALISRRHRSLSKFRVRSLCAKMSHSSTSILARVVKLAKHFLQSEHERSTRSHGQTGERTHDAGGRVHAAAEGASGQSKRRNQLETLAAHKLEERGVDLKHIEDVQKGLKGAHAIARVLSKAHEEAKAGRATKKSDSYKMIANQHAHEQQHRGAAGHVPTKNHNANVHPPSHHPKPHHGALSSSSPSASLPSHMPPSTHAPNHGNSSAVDHHKIHHQPITQHDKHDKHGKPSSSPHTSHNNMSNHKTAKSTSHQQHGVAGGKVKH